MKDLLDLHLPHSCDVGIHTFIFADMNSTPSSSDNYFEQIVDFTDALSHPARMKILQELSQGVRTNGELTRLLPQAQATVSQHIKVLKEAGLIQAEEVGTSMHYSLSPTGIRKLKRALGELIRELPNFTPVQHPRSS